jgi:signal transduction histidine kinase
MLSPAVPSTAAPSRGRPTGSHPAMRPIGWRRLLLLPLALGACVLLLALARLLAQERDIDASWHVATGGRLTLQSTNLPALRSSEGEALDAVTVDGLSPLPIDGRRALQSGRWVADDDERHQTVRQQQYLRRAMAADDVGLTFADGTEVRVEPQPRGYHGLGLTFWLLCGLALALHLVAWAVLVLKPDVRNFLYAVMGQAQAAQLVIAAMVSVPGLARPLMASDEAAWGMAFDVITGAALVHSALIYPTRLPWVRLGSVAAWSLAFLYAGALIAGIVPSPWWWTQAAALGVGLIVISLLGQSHRRLPHPFAAVMRRFGLVTAFSLAFVTLVVALENRLPSEMQALVSALPQIWTVLFAALLLMAPFLGRSQHMMREFAMLAGVSTLAVSFDLLFVALFSFGQFTSLTTSLFIALGLYAALRQWLVDQMIGARVVTTERVFDHLLRIAKKVEQQPERAAQWQLELFSAVFQPLVARHEPMSDGTPRHTQWSDGGGTLCVPLATSPAENDEPRQLVMRFAERGKRLFSSDDARLADRIVEQLRRAVAHDRAIEQGRSEERGRIAQDLHDDIGARLLTLMYKAPNREMEEYVRHTLQDLKTLTRGLAATTHLLSHASGEWKADIAQRLGETGCRLEWSFTQDEDIELGVVHWSALTRILRELVSNIMAHAGARTASIRGQLKNGWLNLVVADDGQGSGPQLWSHGLGLGGIRKRVKLLGGSIEWSANTPRGVRCEVNVPLPTSMPVDAGPD